MMEARETRKPVVIGALAALAALLAVAAARAATVTVNATVTAGTTLSVAGNGTPSFALTLNGDDQTTSYTLPVQVVDARGLAVGGGWNVTVTSTQFSDGAGHVFPATASRITGVTAACQSGHRLDTEGRRPLAGDRHLGHGKLRRRFDLHVAGARRQAVGPHGARVARGTGMGVIHLVVTLSSPTRTAVSFVVS
jgi:hypothetical protein